MHHGGEEELVPQQLRQALATLVQLIPALVLFGDAETDRVTPTMVRGTALGETAGGGPHLADVLDARLHQRFVLVCKRGERKAAFQLFLSQVSAPHLPLYCTSGKKILEAKCL